MRRKLLIGVVAFTSLLALVNAIVILTYLHGATLWSVSRFLVSVFIIGLGLLTWRQIHTYHTRGFISLILFAGAIVVMMLGGVGTILAIHHGQSTGDFEYYLFLMHGLLVSQGLLTLWYLRQPKEPSDVLVTDQW